MRGEDGPSKLSGGEGNDTLYGYTLSDTLNGRISVDRLYGHSGDDTVYTGLTSSGRVDGARDVADCGPGTDTVYYEKGIDAVNANCETRRPY